MVTITQSESKKDEYIVSTDFGWNSQLVFALSREDIRKIAEFNSKLESIENKNKENAAS
jgi:hypothetical protein